MYVPAVHYLDQHCYTCTLLNIHDCVVGMHMYVKRKKVGIKSRQWLCFINDKHKVFNAKLQGSVIYGKLFQGIQSRCCFWISCMYLLNLHPGISMLIWWSIHMNQTGRSRTETQSYEMRIQVRWLFGVFLGNFEWKKCKEGHGKDT